MSDLSQRHRALAAKIAIAFLFFIITLSISIALVKDPVDPGGNRNLSMSVQVALTVSSLVFFFAAVLVLLRACVAYILALLAGVMSLSCFIWIEMSLLPWANAWIMFNLPDNLNEWDQRIALLAKLRIVSVALILLAIVTSGTRLLPANWTLRKSPVRERTWPVVAVSFLAVGAWFAYSVLPYRLPGIVDRGIGAPLKILHVEKHGLRFSEIQIAVMKDGRFYVGRTNRRLFQYRFSAESTRGVLPEQLRSQAMALLQSSRDIRTQPPKALRAWNAEGWYVDNDKSILVYASEARSYAPDEVVDLFREIEQLPVTDTYPEYSVKDVCFGFCFDPLAALGYIYANNRCSTGSDGKTRCQ